MELNAWRLYVLRLGILPYEFALQNLWLEALGVLAQANIRKSAVSKR